MWIFWSSCCLQLCTSWTSTSVFFTKLEEFSATISSNRFSVLFSLSSPSETPIMKMLVCVIYQRPFKVHFFFFLIALPFRWFLLPCLPTCWSVLLHPLISYRWPPVCFSFQLLYSSVLIDFSPHLFVEVLTEYVFSSPEYNDLYDHYLELFVW